MTIRIAMAAFVLAAASAVANAAPIWNGAGWYQSADDGLEVSLLKGPFVSKEACEAGLPKGSEADYFCKYVHARPSWDF